MESSKRPFECLDDGEDGTRKRWVACVGGLEDLQAQR